MLSNCETEVTPSLIWKAEKYSSLRGTRPTKSCKNVEDAWRDRSQIQK